MPARAILLRLLLCVALVFNGAASAMSSVQMIQMHANGQTAVSAPVKPMADTADAMPCHHDMQSSQHHGSANDAKPFKAKPAPVPDCCKSSTCACACVTHVAVMLPMIALHGIAIAHIGSVRSMALGHPAPVLPHLIRPPIG